MSLKIEIDRMELEDVGANPAKLARAIHAQIGPGRGPVPIEAIARAVDIVEIHTLPLFSIEGALLTRAERSYGMILVNASSDRCRRRYTTAHELGHFLNPWHAPTAATGFWCDKADLSRRMKNGLDLHQRQEAEANTFAIELLAPPDRIRSHLAGAPDIEKALAISRDIDISQEAAVRRYVELHDAALAVAFSQNGRLRYAVPGAEFPALNLCRGGQMLDFRAAPPGAITFDDADAMDWLRRGEGFDLTVQTLHQREGCAITLLQAEQIDDAEETEAPSFR